MMLVDTSVFVDLFRNFKPAVDFFLNNDATEIVTFSAITEIELLAGSYCNNRDYRERTLHFLSKFKEIPIDKRVTLLAGDIARKSRLEVPDAVIAASALVTRAVLVTLNIKDFEKVEELKIKKPY